MDSSLQTKRKIRIGTHDGSFHCDEALACFMLRLLPEYQDAEIVRTRDPKILNECDIVVDVGAQYDPARHRYDHHQREFTDTLDENHKVTKLSSAGLIYKHFGRQIIQKVLNISDSQLTERMFYLLYKKFIEAVDANDNGVPRFGVAKPVYEESTSLGARVGKLNPNWNESNVDVQERFLKASNMAGEEFLDCLNYFFKSWLPARVVVERAFKKRVDETGDERIILFDGHCPWKNHLFDIEEEEKSNPIYFALFTDSNGSWRVQGVPKHPDSFECRVYLPDEWKGVRDDNLSSVSDIKDCVFVHASGFIGGNKTREGALQMAKKALKIAEEKGQIPKV